MASTVTAVPVVFPVRSPAPAECRCARNHLRMPLLRERPAPDTVASLNRHVAAKHARDALDRRLTQLEHEHAEFQ